MTTVLTPAADERWSAALAAMHDVKRDRGRLLRQIRAGDVTVNDLLLDPPECVRNMRAFEVVEWLAVTRRTARTRVRRLNSAAMTAQPPVNLFRPLGQLTDRERSWLTEHIPGALAKPYSRAA